MLSKNENNIVLIVEDIASNHMLIERSLAKIGIGTLWATNGEEAVQFCHEFSNINLIMMDLRLPKLDGFEATRQIRSFKPDVPIIAQTAYVMPYEKSLVLEAGCTDLITKPYRSEEIIKIVQKYI